MIKIICFGKLKENYLINAVNDYFERINKCGNKSARFFTDQSFHCPDLISVICVKGDTDFAQSSSLVLHA